MPRLLELSVVTEHILRDMSVYASLGFQELPVNEIVPYHYAVLGDGDFHVGVHAASFDSPTLTYVVPDVAHYASALLGLNIEFERADLGEEQFNQISFLDPADQRINLIEARTFSPAFDDELLAHPFGAFVHIELPHTTGRERFWAQLQAVLEPETEHSNNHNIEPMVQLSSTCERLTIVYEGDLDAVIVRSAQEGWQHFSVTADDNGLYRSPHHFNLLVRRLDN